MEKQQENVHELLKRLDTLFKDIHETHIYPHTYEITKISNYLRDMKLSDSFFIRDLSKEEQELLDHAIIIAQSSK